MITMRMIRMIRMIRMRIIRMIRMIRTITRQGDKDGEDHIEDEDEIRMIENISLVEFTKSTFEAARNE